MIGYGAKEMANAFRTVRKNTIQVANDIPEDQYDFVAAPGVSSVRALLAHVALAPMLYLDMHRDKRVTTLKGYDFGVAIARANAAEAKPRTKAEILDLLATDGDSFATWLDSLSTEFLAETFTDPAGQNPRTRFESLLGVKEHEMHHRGQLTLIERILGIVPHLTRQREERVRQHQTTAAGAR